MTANGRRFGLKLPNCGGAMFPPEWASAETIESIAHQAAANGFESVWLQDHLLTPRELSHLPRPVMLEPLTVAMWLAPLIPQLRLGFATLVLPLRDPVLLAKQLATASYLCPGRVIAGIGIGRYESEFESFGSDAYRLRGKVTEEYLTILSTLLRADGESATIEGTFRSVRDAEMFPRPSEGDLSIWVASRVEVGVLRAARLADGWITGGMPFPAFADACNVYRQGQTDAGKDPSAGVIAVNLRLDSSEISGKGGPDPYGHGYLLRGTAAEVGATLAEYASIGASQFIVSFPATDLGEMAEKLEWFRSDVRPIVTGDGP
jgi:alkanesulfonate monooxygenase SsuD/methylene tetrahydromethanopterin reductase-like flavin-dependent oxidoreductase (luciferase family)